MTIVMNSVIFKYPISMMSVTPSTLIQLQMPKGARILKVQEQGSHPPVPTLWALVNQENDMEVRTFVVYGTGQQMNTDRKEVYLGTAMCDPFVWHVFEVK
jgi:hypothetical protein